MDKVSAIAPCFVHSLFRAGSTYFFSVIKRAGPYAAFHEPFHEVIGDVARSWSSYAERTEDYKKLLRHDFLQSGYFEEYAHLLPQIRESFDIDNSYRRFFIESGADCPPLEKFIDVLLAGAQGRPVLQCTRTFGRIEWLKKKYGGAHIFLLRNPWDQWFSYTVDPYIGATVQVTYAQPGLPAVLEAVARAAEYEPQEAGQSLQEAFASAVAMPISPYQHYYLFFGLWVYAWMNGRRECDLILDMDALTEDVAARAPALLALDQLGLPKVRLDDCRLHQGHFRPDEREFYEHIERQVLELFRRNGQPVDAISDYLEMRSAKSFADHPDAKRSSLLEDAVRARASAHAAMADASDRIRSLTDSSARYGLQIGALEQDLAARAAEVGDLRHRLSEALESQLADAASAEAKLAETLRTLEERGAEVATLRELAQNRAQSIEALSELAQESRLRAALLDDLNAQQLGRISTLSEELGAQEVLAEAAAAKIEQLTADLSQREERLQAAQVQVDELSAQAMQREERLHAAQVQIDELSAQAMQREERLHAARVQIDELSAQATQREERLYAAQVQIDELSVELQVLQRSTDLAESKLAAVLASTTWRIMAPIRAAWTLAALTATKPSELPGYFRRLFHATPKLPQPMPARPGAALLGQQAGATTHNAALDATSRVKLTFFTICSKNFLAYAHTLYQSVQEHHPGSKFYVALCDRVDGYLDVAAEPFDIIDIDALGIPKLPEMIERYNITELNTSIKPFVFEYLFTRTDAENVVYLDPDILVVGPMLELESMLADGAQAVLTPHVLNPAEGVEVDDIKMLQLGVYNLGFLALRRSERTLEIVRWWGRRLETECVIDLPRGLFVDQKWADLLPSYIPQARILHHPGYNVAYWNLQQRKISKTESGWLAGSGPLRFVHFSGNKLDDESVFSRHSWQLTVHNIGDMKLLLDEYRSRVFANRHEHYSKLPYAFSWNGSSGVNLHTPQQAQETRTEQAAPAAAVVVRPVVRAVPSRLDRKVVGSSRLQSRISGLLTTLGRARVHSGGWLSMGRKAIDIYRRGGMPLVSSTIRQLNLIYPHRTARPFARALSEPAPIAVVGPAKRLLFVDWSTPRPDRDAGSITAFYLMKIYVDLGYDVTFIPSDLEELGDYTKQVQHLGVRCLHAEQVGSMQAHLAAHGREYDFAFLCRAPIADLYIDDLRRYAPQAQIILNTSDLHYLRHIREAEIEESAEKMAAALAWKERELSVISRCDHSIVMSDHELAVLAAELPGASVHLVPLMFVDIPGRAQGYSERKDLLFIGGFPHIPNVDAVVYFCENIWPKVRQHLPDARCHLLGSSPPAEVEALGSLPGVNVVGYVDDLAPWFNQIRLSIAPLRYGAGIKGKLGTSLSFGVPSVATTIAVEGMGLEHESQVLVADDPDQFAKEVVRLYTDPALWERLSTQGLEYVTRTYSVAAGFDRIKAFMDHVDTKSVQAFPAVSVGSAEEYETYFNGLGGEYARRADVELALIRRDQDGFLVDGFCAVCNQPSSFNCSFMYAYETTADGQPIPNWREHLDCVQCGFINRIRAAIHVLDTRMRPRPDADIYISEQTTPLYRWLKQHYPNTRGSEYLGDKVPPGQELNGLRNEDLMALTWESGSFDHVLSFDVLEHVPDPVAAFSECFRILRPGGTLLWAAPFAFDEHRHLVDRNIVRAHLDATGEIVHLMEPEYHGNPVDPENGALCFQYFSKEVLEQLRQVGFENVELLFYWSRDLAYLGGEQLICMARKPLN
ncbi:glycosyltransferase [Lysobacter terrae]